MRERLVLGAFVIVVLFGGANFVAGKITIREPSPFWAATLRLAAAATLLFAFVAVPIRSRSAPAPGLRSFI